MKPEKTARGFRRVEFDDRYGAECSIQESSLATEAAIWLGINEVRPRILVPGEGWKAAPLPDGAMCAGRMHLTQEMAAALLPLLQCFVETGRLPDDLATPAAPGQTEGGR